jgi:peptide/nickel transport system substrate-binding protein
VNAHHRQPRRGLTGFAATICALLVAMLAAACGEEGGAGGGGETAAGGSRTLTIAIAGDIETVDPAFSHFQRSNEVNYNIYDQFFQYGTTDSGEGYQIYDVDTIEGRSIESWEMSEDGRSITLNVRPGMKFNKTGNPVTAEDFRYWFERSFGAEAPSLFSIQTAKIPDIAAVEARGDDQLVIRFAEPSPLFFYLFRDQAQAPPDSKELAEHATAEDEWATRWATKNDAGSGPFFIERWEPGVQLVLRANEDYWAGAPYFDRVVLKIVPSSSQRVLLLQEGTVDIAQELSIDELDRLRQAEGVKVLSAPTRNQIMVGLNNTQEPFDDPRVRQALAYAVPYDEIVDSVYRGNAQTPDSVIPKTGRFHTEGLWPYTYDLDKARALLEEAGVGDGFSMNLAVQSGNPTFEELAVVIQSEFKKIGVDVQIDKQSAAVFAKGLDDRSHQAWLRDLLFYVDDPGYAGELTYKSEAVLNWVNYTNKRVDELITQMGQLWRPEDDAAKQELADEYQRILNEEIPALILVQTNFDVAMRDDIEGYVQNPDNLLFYYPLRRSGS